MVTYQFPGRTSLPHRPHRVFHRSLGDKFQEIALRSPADMIAFDRLADAVLARLNAEERRQPK